MGSEELERDVVNKRVKVMGGWYRTVPSLYNDFNDDKTCQGCAFDYAQDREDMHKHECCTSHKFRSFDGDCPEGIIFIECGKEALAKYLAERMSV